MGLRVHSGGEVTYLKSTCDIMPPMPPRKTTSKMMEEAPEPVARKDETLTFKATHFYAVLVVLAFGLGIMVGYLAWGRTPPAPVPIVVTQVAGPPVPATPTLQVVQYDIPVEGFPSLGPDDAPITIVEFSDYQCPYCTRWHEETYGPLMQAYPDQIRFVYRNFPLSFHQNAMLGAQAALCAGDQDAYWPYHDKLFEEKEQLNNPAGTTLEPEVYVGYAEELGLDTEAFGACLADEKYRQFVEDDMVFAAGLPTENGEPAVGGTPTFFINGRRLVGAYPLPAFQQIIDEVLAEVQ
jgi:protein-disulfide isomerase